jgi:hypothetical protein
MTTPTRIEVNVQTGEVKEIELQGEELAEYEAALATQAEGGTPPAD